ncbi:MAG: hypothetical protein V1888_02945 [archaeon]
MLVISPVIAKDFVIYNTTNPSQNYFSVNGSSGITSGNFFGSWNGSSNYVPYTGANQNLVLGNNNFSVGTSDLFVNEGTGNVGIGTTAPGAKLEVAQSDGNGLRFTRSGHESMELRLVNSDRLSFYNVGDVREDLVILDNGNVGIGTTGPTLGKLQINDASGGGNVVLALNEPLANRRIEFITPTSGGAAAQIRTAGTSNGLLIKSSSGGNQLFLKDDGNVGIGTTTPVTSLHLAGSTTTALPATSGTTQSTGNRLRIGSVSGVGNGILDIGNVPGGNAWLQVTDSSNLAVNYNLLLNPNGGNVGIGTTSPSSLFHVAGNAQIGTANTANTDLFIYGAAGQGSLDLQTRTGYNALISNNTSFIYSVTGASSYFAQQTNGVERLRITSTGNVGIGTTSPARKLHINDTMRIEPTSTAPSSASLGDLYVDSDTNELCFYNSTAWVGLSGGGVCA